MYRKLTAPIVVHWELTAACNQRCIHCYNYWRTGSIPNRILPNYKELFETTTREIGQSGAFAVVITGGEPLLVISEAFPYIKALSDMGIEIMMNSNLIEMTPEKAQLLIDCGIISILVSMPSASPQTCDSITSRPNSLKDIVSGIDLVKKYGIPVAVNMVVSKRNFDEIEATAALVSSMGISSFAVTRASNPVKNSDFSREVLSLEQFRVMLKRLEEIREKYGLKTDSLEANPVCAFGNQFLDKVHRYCGAGKSTCTVGFDGQIRPCNRLPITYDNIFQGLLSAWEKMDDCRNNKWLPEKCGKCDFKYRCRGGCKADALIEFEDITREDPLCDFNETVKFLEKSNISTTEDYFLINPKLRIRPEEFGSIAYVNTANWLPITKRLADLLNRKRKEVIGLDTIAKEISATEDEARLSTQVLVEKQILKTQRRKNERSGLTAC